MGHNFGASHSFEEGKGKTGGIMDYGDVSLNGRYQFNSKYRKEQICKSIKSSYEQCTDYMGIIEVLKTCGNREIDLGEECECEDGSLECTCCSKCRLKLLSDAKLASCSPYGNPCCTDKCEFKPTKSGNVCTRPDGSNGYCSNGNCLNSCSRWTTHLNGTFCGIQEGNDCTLKCYDKNSMCIDMDGWAYTEQGVEKKVNWVADGSRCEFDSSGELGVCESGKCTLGGRANMEDKQDQGDDMSHEHEPAVFILGSMAAVMVLLVAVRIRTHEARKYEQRIDYAYGKRTSDLSSIQNSVSDTESGSEYHTSRFVSLLNIGFDSISIFGGLDPAENDDAHHENRIIQARIL
mmetsp:Transcript_15968/g.19814  ORF Transcript_15968/g.19814 Transcript_15968/m.19814 type:complete len:348 (+) Transcript_15968:421-1464(+)